MELVEGETLAERIGQVFKSMRAGYPELVWRMADGTVGPFDSFPFGT